MFRLSVFRDSLGKLYLLIINFFPSVLLYPFLLLYMLYLFVANTYCFPGVFCLCLAVNLLALKFCHLQDGWLWWVISFILASCYDRGYKIKFFVSFIPSNFLFLFFRVIWRLRWYFCSIYWVWKKWRWPNIHYAARNSCLH